MTHFFPRFAVVSAVLALLAPQLFAAPPNDSVVVFNEIHYNPPAGDAAEYVEITNVMGVNVDISGWRISSGIDFVFPNGTVIAGGASLVIAKTPATYPGSIGPFTGALSNGGETLRLRDNNDRTLDELTYGDKGSWPVAPDGGGVSLAKRSPFTNSDEAGSWTSSVQATGTPGAANFPPPPAPQTARFVNRHDTWSFDTSGSVPSTWNSVAFDDSAWSTGPAGLHVGNPSIYLPPPPAPTPGGQWFVKPWTGDADSEISSSKSYTHKIGINHNGGYLPINGVTFDSPGPGVLSAASWSLTGAPFAFAGNGGNNNMPAGTGSRQFIDDFYYGANNAGATSRLTLSQLTSGQTYTVTFYSVGWGAQVGRQTRITPSDTGIGYLVDQNLYNNGNGQLVRYRYIAPGNGVITFDFADTAGATWHHYAFSNEVSPAMVPQSEIAGVSVSSFSSELGSPYTRLAAHSTNGSGLVNGQHTTAPDGNMWLSAGVVLSPNDTLPADITYDLGSTVDLAGFNVWNYNETTNGLMTRGANEVIVQTAPTVGGTFTTAATLNFRKASGVSSEPGERFDLNVSGVRLVKLIINTSHNGDADLVGLSEIKFFKQGLDPVGPSLFKESIRPGRNTGVNADHSLATTGTGDAHWTNVTTSQPAIVMNGHPAWLGIDGVSQWIGASANGTDNAADGQSTYRTTFDLTGYSTTDTDVRFYAAIDNVLDNVVLNGVSKGITVAGFNPFNGPLTIPGPFNAGVNTVDFLWTNAGAGPGAFRMKWDVVTPPVLGRTALPVNPVTTYARRKFTHTGAATSSYRLRLDFIADDGAVFYLNGTELHRMNLPAGAISGSTLASSDVTYPRFNGIIEVPAGALLPGQQNVLAVELHQAGASNVDAFMLATLDVEETQAPIIVPSVRLNEVASSTAAAGQFFVEIQNTGTTSQSLTGYQVRSATGQVYTFGATTLAAGALLTVDEATLGFRPADGVNLYFASPTAAIDAVVTKIAAQARNNSGAWLTPNAGTAGAANTFALNTSIVINEIMYNHHPAHLPTGTVPSAEEWVELYNRTASPVSIAGWKLTGGMSYTFATGTNIAANSYLVVAKDPTALLVKFPGINAIGPVAGSLSNSGDRVTLEDGNGNPASEVRYFDEGRWNDRADGGGSSLELIHPDTDNSQPEAWAASDETSKSQWVNISYTGTGARYPGTTDPSGYNEFIFGMINAGECLVDDVSLKEVSVGNRELIQNGSFTSGTNTWRLLGNHGGHGRSIAVPDPSASGNNVMRIVATSGGEHMHNHCETTFANGIVRNSASTYTASFRARWISGSPRLQSRIYFNRLTKQHLLPIPDNTGSPGAQNSRYTALTGPTYSGLSQSVVLPIAQQPVTIRIAAADPQGVTSMDLKWKVNTDSTFTTAAMSLANGAYEAQIPGQNAGALVQFYVQGSDGTTSSTYPAAGASSRALIRWQDGTAPTTAGHGIRILMTTADANWMHSPINVMSNDYQPCTIVYRESEVFYDAQVRLKSSQRGRLDDSRLGFAIQFDPMQKFRGAHTTINIDRSGYGRGTTGAGTGHSEIVVWHMLARAGGIPSMYNDMVYVIAPRSTHNGSGILTMAEFNDVWADSQFENGAAYPTFKYELIYYPTTTNTGTPEGFKLPQPDSVVGVEFGTIVSADKEAFRWNFLIGNARNDDNYTRVMNLSDTYRLTGAAFNTAIVDAIDVDQWLRTSAGLALAGIGDNYATSAGAWHNLKLYHRSDGRILYLPWDLDFQSQPANDPLIINPDITALTAISPGHQRRFYQHLKEIIATSFNTAYLTSWVNHYSTFNTSGGNWGEIPPYVTDRVAFVQSQINSAYPPTAFDITTTGFTTSNTSTTITGAGGLDIASIIVQTGGLILPVTWTSATTWSVSVPVINGTQTITLLAYDAQGNLLGSDSVTGTSTGGVAPAAAGNLVISEIHYHPANPAAGAETTASADKNEFEFIEVRNISPTQTISLTGCRFTGGVLYTFPDTTLAPGAYAVVPRNTAAFTARYPAVSKLAAYNTSSSGSYFLSNGGEQFALISSTGAEIVSVTYGDNTSPRWPASPDGNGPSLVLIAPLTNPNPNDPLNWRASTTNHGSPGTSDALMPPANPNADSDGDGINDLLEQAVGIGAMPNPASILVTTQPTFTVTFERDPRADVNWSFETNTELTGPWTPIVIGTDYQLTTRTILPNGIERFTLQSTTPITGPRGFIRAVLRIP